MLVYVMRHGESENNERKLYTGWFDSPLTDQGVEEAKNAGALMRSVSFDKIYSSDLKRAIETVEAAIPGCSYELSPLLREIKMGNLENQPLSNLTDEERSARLLYGYTDIGGESRVEFRDRVLKFKSELEALDCERVAIFSHAGWLRAFLTEVIGVRLSSKVLRCGNCAVAIFEYDKSSWKLHSWINSLQ